MAVECPVSLSLLYAILKQTFVVQNVHISHANWVSKTAYASNLITKRYIFQMNFCSKIVHIEG